MQIHLQYADLLVIYLKNSNKSSNIRVFIYHLGYSLFSFSLAIHWHFFSFQSFYHVLCSLFSFFVPPSQCLTVSISPLRQYPFHTSHIPFKQIISKRAFDCFDPDTILIYYHLPHTFPSSLCQGLFISSNLSSLLISIQSLVLVFHCCLFVIHFLFSETVSENISFSSNITGIPPLKSMLSSILVSALFSFSSRFASTLKELYTHVVICVMVPFD